MHTLIGAGKARAMENRQLLKPRAGLAGGIS